MAERGGGDLLERLGPDLSAAVLRCLDDPADVVRSASVSQSWHLFVIRNGFCKKLCLRTTPEISCFVRAIEIGGLSYTMEVGPNCSTQWQTLDSEHRIYAFLGYRIVSTRFLIEITLESISASTTTGKIENMMPNNIASNMFSSYWSSKGKSSLTFKLTCKFCVVHEIKIQLRKVENLCIRLGNMRDENATSDKSLAGNIIWTYVSPEFSMIETDDFQSLKLQRPIMCIDGLLQIELLSRNSTDELPTISASQIKAIVCPLPPVFDASLLDRKGNANLMYFPGAKQYLEDADVQHEQPSRRWRYKSWNKTKRMKKNHQESYFR